MAETTASERHLETATKLARGRVMSEPAGFAASALLRAAAFCAGAAFFITAVGLWAFTSPDASVMLVKLGASILFLGGAAVFLLIALAPHDFYRLELDTAVQELRVFERDESGRFFLQKSQPLAEISKINFEAGALRARGSDGKLLLSVPMRGADARITMRAILALN
jgi:hypothetical protein